VLTGHAGNMVSGWVDKAITEGGKAVRALGQRMQHSRTK
jgi:hypothetical protein